MRILFKKPDILTVSVQVTKMIYFPIGCDESNTHSAYIPTDQSHPTSIKMEPIRAQHRDTAPTEMEPLPVA